MIIYELIYYYDDVRRGPNIIETLLLTSILEVDKKVDEFKNLNSSNCYSANCGKLEGFIGEYYNYSDSKGNSNILEIRKHSIIN